MIIAKDKIPEQDQTGEHRRAFYLLMAITLGSVLVISRYLEPSRVPVLCFFRLMTGLPCLTCGMTRAFHAISLGYFWEAIEYHPLSPLVYGLMLFHCLVAILRFSGWRFHLLVIRSPGKRMVYVSLTLLFVCWIARLFALATTQ
ncbi:MAG: DUF2752 domain-containing protein [Chloroflexi bacterium]|nr:DUF2752 domain-containing protein [Chloroflexota bacterium]